MSEPLTVEVNGQPITASMGEWRAVRAAINARETADHKAWEQSRRDAGQVWYALYWRHFSEYAVECFSREEAENIMEWDDQANAGIVNPDGTFEPQWLYKQSDLKRFERALAEAKEGR